jgi:iron complex transport system permease protein
VKEAERLLRALATRDTGSLAINVLMSFGAVAVVAGIIALEPAFTTGAALGVALVVIGLGISFFAAEEWGLLGTATTIIGALLLAGGVIGFVEAEFTGLAFSALLFLALAVAIRSNFLMALVPLALAGALGSSTGYRHAVYMLTVNEPSITIAFFALFAGAALPNLAARRASVSALGDHFCPSIADSRQFRLLDRLAVGRLSG